MSDSNSSSTGSSGSSTNSWTLLSPEEAAVENVGPVDDGTESLGDVPSLSEEVAGAAVELKLTDIPPETVLSEEGHQVCQETSPESSEGPVPSSPTRLSPAPPPLTPLDPADVDLESQPPVIHDIVASSPSDNEPVSAVPFVTNMDFMAPLDLAAARPSPPEPEEPSSAPPLTEVPISAEPGPDTPADTGLSPASPADQSPVLTAGPKVSVRTETLTATDPPAHTEDDTSLMKDRAEPPGLVPESLATESSMDDAQETVGSTESAEQSTVEKEEMEPAEPGTQDVIEPEEEEEEEPSGGFSGGSSSSRDDDGLRRRNVPSFEVPRPRTSDEEEEEEEEMEFKLAERTEAKPWFSLNKCIVGVVVLLFLGSLFLSGDFDASELSDGEQSQDWISSDPQDMKELLDKLTQENQQISQLEAQLQSQKQELESALQAGAGSGDERERADLEKENVKLKEELSSLPELKKELESLRARVTELSQLTAGQETPSSAQMSGSNQNSAGPDRRKSKKDGDKLKEELQRQKVLLDESRTRLQGMKKDGGDRRRVTDSLEEIQKKLSEQVEQWGQRKPQESKWKGNKDKSAGRDQWRKDEKKERRAEKPSKEGGWRDREERKEKERKSQKQNPHKESWRKHQDEWERKKDERRMDREERRKEKPWHGRPAKSSHSQQHHQARRSPQHHHDFWKDQEQKIRRNIGARPGCSSVEDCAGQEGLYPVELSEFEELLEGYLSKLEGSSPESKDRIRKLTADFFQSGVFIHQTLLFSDFAEDVADILEDMVDVLQDSGQKGDDALEEEMEEFEREALWKFAATV